MVLFHFIRYLRISVAKLQQKLNNTTKGRNILFIFFKTGITTPFVDIFMLHSSIACYSRQWLNQQLAQVKYFIYLCIFAN